MTDETQSNVGAGYFLVKPRIRIRWRGMGRIRALLDSEVDFAIAGSGFGAEHRIGLGRAGVAIGGRLKAGQIAGIIVALRTLDL